MNTNTDWLAEDETNYIELSREAHIEIRKSGSYAWIAPAIMAGGFLFAILRVAAAWGVL